MAEISVDGMAEHQKRQQESPEAIPPSHGPHPALHVRHALWEDTGPIYRMALSPDGRILAAPAEYGTVTLWDCKAGRVARRLLGHNSRVICAGWSSDGQLLATGGGYDEHALNVWESQSGRLFAALREGDSSVLSIAWRPASHQLAFATVDDTVRLWIPGTPGGGENLKEHNRAVWALCWSPDGELLCSGGDNEFLCLWNVSSHSLLIKQRQAAVRAVAWSPDQRTIASTSHDKICIWDSALSNKKYVLEGHTAAIVSILFADEGRLLVSYSDRGELIVWRTNTWSELLRINRIGDGSDFTSVALHPKLPVMAARGAAPSDIRIWDLDFPLLRQAKPEVSAVSYVNAKAVLVGDSGVGKSALGIRIAEGRFRHTEGSTHGAQFWHFPHDRLGEQVGGARAELTLWDLAGQPEYRLTHQLFLDDTDAALLLFDCSDSSNPFHGVPYWAKVLRKQAPTHALKLLVSARCDVSAVTVDAREINSVLARYGLDAYVKTSANTGEGVEALFQRLLSGIRWDRLPCSRTPLLFQFVREFVLAEAARHSLISMSEVEEAVREHLDGRIPSTDDFETVIQLLQSKGLVFRVQDRPEISLILLRPELINQYGAAIIQAARNHSQGIGAVTEKDVLTGTIAFTGFKRLSRPEEAIVLQSTVELLIQHDLCFREMGYLVFPSQINVSRVPSGAAHPRAEVAYRFSGSIETIYASLVVRLNYTNYFHRENQWKYTVEFSRRGKRLGFAMQEIEEGTGELEIYFETDVDEFDRVTFIRFVTDHLVTNGIDIEERIHLYCPKCSNEVTNRHAIETRVLAGELDIPCQYCSTAILIPTSIEERYRHDKSLQNKQQELADTVDDRAVTELDRFRSDKQHYPHADLRGIRVLHISDLHICDQASANVYQNQLESDLIQELGIRRLNYLVISGDIANRSTEDEYRSAFGLVDGIVKRFGLDSSRVMVVPGNHDVNWALSKKAYPFVYRDELPSPLPRDRYIPAGDVGGLLRDEGVYRERFAIFSNHFHRRVYSGREYPPEYADQYHVIENSDDRILFLGLNSCWQLDHHFQQRASINMEALGRAINHLLNGSYNDWLKIAVWHHPVTGTQMMNDEFMQLLAVNGFQICMHGHIHEAMQCFHVYDDRRGIRIVGAGTFGAPANEQVTGIPLQYNLLTIDPKAQEVTVQTRKKEKAEGAWSADARWGSKNNPKPSYRFRVRA